MEPHEMRKHRLRLDEPTADGLAAGRLDAADAPPGYGTAATLLTAARGDGGPSEPDPRLLEAMVHAIRTAPTTDQKAPMTSKLRSTRVGALAAVLVLSTAGAAAAATGNLPDPAQDAVSSVADRVGIEIPAGQDDDATTSDEERTTGNVDNPTDADAHGVEVSDVARDRSTTGREHGQAVSEVARNGHGPDAADEDESTDEDEDGTEADEQSNEGRGRPEDPGSQAPVDTPNGGGTGTAGQASGGRSDVGTGHAPGQAQAGSGNADDNPSTDD